MKTNTYAQMTIAELLCIVKSHYEHNNYTKASIQTLVIGMMEEAGELAEQILLQYSEDYTPSKDKKIVPIAEEIGDIIVYCLALCNKLGISPTFRNLHDS